MNTLRSRLILYLLSGLIPVFLLIAYIGENYAREYTYRAIVEKAAMLTSNAAKHIEHILANISSKPRIIAVLAEENTSIKRIEALMHRYVSTDKLIYGMAMAFLPRYSQTGSFFCPYFYSKGKKVFYKSLVPPSYNYLKFEWFRKPIETNKASWSEPYFDKGGGEIWMSTYSVPIRNRNGKPIGVATADASIGFLSRIISKIHVLKTGGAFIVSKKGHILAPLEGFECKQSVKNVISALNSGRLKDIVASSRATNKLISFNIKGKRYLIHTQPIYGTKWNIAVVFPQNELFEPLKKLNFYFLFVILAGIGTIVAVVFLVSKNTTRDIERVQSISQLIANGNFDVPIPEGLSYEALSIAKALETMQKSLKAYIERLKEQTRMESELKLAKSIQETFIPKHIKTTINNIQIESFTKLAREVGGDFYGITKKGDSGAVFYLGDVSGKGVPAALYVAVVKNTLDILINQNTQPSELAGLLNEYLSRFSSSGMFATIFIGNIDNNALKYCNAGHLPPLLYTDNSLSTLPLLGNPPVGALSGLRFTQREIPLHHFNGMLIFSDGLTEAQNENGQLLGDEAVCKAVFENLSSPSIARQLLKLQENFTGKAPLYDDTTIMEIRWA